MPFGTVHLGMPSDGLGNHFIPNLGQNDIVVVLSMAPKLPALASGMVHNQERKSQPVISARSCGVGKPASGPPALLVAGFAFPMKPKDIELLYRNHIHRGDWLRVMVHYLERAELSVRQPICDREDLLEDLRVIKGMLQLTDQRAELIERDTH